MNKKIISHEKEMSHSEAMLGKEWEKSIVHVKNCNITPLLG